MPTMMPALLIDQLRLVRQRARSRVPHFRKYLCALLTALMALALLPHSAAAENPAVKAMPEYAFALRVAGLENVLVLQTGIEGWRKDGAHKP